MRKFVQFIISTTFLMLISCHSYGQYDIEIRTNGWKDTTMILGYYYQGEDMLVADTFNIDKHGKAIIKSDTLLPNGIYTAYFPNKTFFDILLGQDQTLTISVDTADFINSQVIKGSSESEAFAAYHKFMQGMQKKRTDLISHYRPLIQNKDSLAVAKQKLQELNDKVSEKWDTDYKKYQGTFYGTIIKSFIPVKYEPEQTPEYKALSDSVKALKRYYFEANHYFDNTDLTEPGLWRTSFYKERITHYLDKVLIPQPDSITPYALRLIQESKPDKTCFRFMATTVLNFAVKSDIMGMESLSVAVSKKYYLNEDAYWADSTLLSKLAELVAKEEHTLLGKTAPDLVMEDWQEGYKSLHQVDAPYTILIFFEPNCSHCKVIVPEVYEKIWKKYEDKGLAVYCVYTQTNREEWEKFINDKELYGWTHVWDPYNQTNFRYYYDVSVTPRIFLLDKDKKIIGKKLGVETLDLMLDRLYRNGKI
ncbi:TlpA family protein disulfide reductase [Saccharicrinis sp. FJH62]|uniref:TlpA family protein disulfide reductase n=1 Tax=Saccharicrinis sp. FJH62 TaxID=3344657 RepID=UPI0035D4EB66